MQRQYGQWNALLRGPHLGLLEPDDAGYGLPARAVDTKIPQLLIGYSLVDLDG
jgi:hypothetical protein